jgi:hypothetical protein
MMSILMMLQAAASIMQPVQINVPPYIQYCSATNPILGSDYAKPEIRSAAFDLISDQVEKAGLTARALAIGVPFVDSVARTPSSHATPADDDEANATYVVRICSVVPADKAAAFPSAGIEHVAARSVYANLCDSADLDECRRKVEASVQATNPSTQVLLRTRQALSSDASPPSLIAAMTDSSLIVLRTNDPAGAPPPPAAAPSAPPDLAIVSGEPSN